MFETAFSVLCEGLSHSTTMCFCCSVCLEWNAVGMLETAFSVLCEGLTHNTKLQILDLRNNQISHDGATHLASALKVNGTLRSLGQCRKVNKCTKVILCNQVTSRFQVAQSSAACQECLEFQFY